MKKFIPFLIIMILLHLSIYNPMDDLVWSFEFITQGSVLDPDQMEKILVPYNLLFSTAMFILFISRICNRISDIFHLRSYVITRGGHRVFKRLAIKKAFIEIIIILSVKLMLHLLFSIIEQHISDFVFYDLISTFLTLNMFSLVYILFKLNGINDKISLFVLIAGNMVAQVLSFEVSIISIIVIASIHWYNQPVIILSTKALILLLLTVFVFFKKNINQMLEVKNHD